MMADGLDERGGDGIGADAGVGRQHALHGRIGPPGRTPMRGPRVLCLHGYHGSAAILRWQMAPLAAAIPTGVELVYADAPALGRG